MLLLCPLTAPRIVGTDLLHAALLLWVAGAGHLLHGNVDLHAMAWLLVGSIPGVLIGSHLSIRVPERALRTAFALRADPVGHQARRGARRDDDHRDRRSSLGALALVAWLGLQFRRVRLRAPRACRRLDPQSLRPPFSNNPAVDCRG